MKDEKKISRVYKTLTYRPEKKLLDLLSSKLYKIVTADQLTFFAFFGAILVAVSYQFAGKSLNYLHLANLGILIHWFGDSLDGRVAGLRGESRPLYGHYLDHMMDSIGVVTIFVGIAMSPIATSMYWLVALALALLIFNHAYLKASVTSILKLSMSKIGGTEARILFILFNLSLIISTNPNYIVLERKLFFSDILIIIFSIILGLTLVREISLSLWGKNKIKN